MPLGGAFSRNGLRSNAEGAVSCLAGVKSGVYDNATAPVGNHIAVLLEGIADKSLDLHDPKYTNKPAIACQRLQKSEREAELLYNSE